MSIRILIRSMGLFVLTSALTACARESRTVSTSDVDSVIEEMWQKIKPATPSDRRARGQIWQRKVTTWLPSQWPPTAQTVWTQYAYGLDVTLDGIAGVSAPFARIERGTGDRGLVLVTPMAHTIKTVANHPVRPHPGWHCSEADEKRILAAVLQLTTAPKDAREIRDYYRSWRLGSAEIAAQVASRHREFFKWLDEP